MNKIIPFAPIVITPLKFNKLILKRFEPLFTETTKKYGSLEGQIINRYLLSTVAIIDALHGDHVIAHEPLKGIYPSTQFTKDLLWDKENLNSLEYTLVDHYYKPIQTAPNLPLRGFEKELENNPQLTIGDLLVYIASNSPYRELSA